MKNYIPYIAIGALLVNASCNHSTYAPLQKRSIAVSQMVDHTDTLDERPDTNALFSFLNLDEYSMGSVELRTQAITDVEYNRVYAATLPECAVLLFNADARKKEIADFKKDAAKGIDTLNNQKFGLPKSSVYSPIIRELNDLATTKADKKVALIYSDLSENTTGFSIYETKDKLRLKKRPNIVKAFFYGLRKPANLKGVEVHFIFKARTEADNERFLLMSAFFEQMLTEAGAKVYIGANLVTNKN